MTDRRIFLSYSRIDDEVPSVDPNRYGWVRYLYDQLRVALRQRLAGDLDFWRDKTGIDDSERFRPLIDAALAEADLMLAIISPSYLQRPWCRYELDEFYKRRARLPADARAETIVKVLKHKLDDLDSLPEALRDRGGYAFYAEDPETGREDPFFLNGRLRREIEYFDTIARLVNYLVERLVGKPGGANVPGGPAIGGDAIRHQAVFLARPTGADATEAFTRLARELARLGCDVLPEIGPPLPESDAEVRDCLRQALARAEFAVHVLGHSGGIVPAEGETPLAHLQLDLAAEAACRPGFTRHLWLLRTHGDARGAHREYLTSLQQDADAGGRLLHSDVRMEEIPGRQELQDFVQHLLSVVRPLAPSAGAALAAVRSPDSALRIWIGCAPEDVSDARASLRDPLFDAGFDPAPVLGSRATEAERNEQAARELRVCDVVLVFWGKAGLSAIDSMLAWLRGAERRGRERPFALTALVIGPPDDEDKAGFRTRAVDLCIDCKESGLSFATLQPLLARLRPLSQ